MIMMMKTSDESLCEWINEHSRDYMLNIFLGWFHHDCYGKSDRSNTITQMTGNGRRREKLWVFFLLYLKLHSIVLMCRHRIIGCTWRKQEINLPDSGDDDVCIRICLVKNTDSKATQRIITIVYSNTRVVAFLIQKTIVHTI